MKLLFQQAVIQQNQKNFNLVHNYLNRYMCSGFYVRNKLDKVK